MNQLDLRGKRVLIRQDLNVPIEDGRITSAARIDAALGTIRLALERGAAVLLMSHLGRPPEDSDDDSAQRDPAFSLVPVAVHLSDALGREVAFHDDYLCAAPRVAAGEVALLENVRFNRGEKANDDGLARRYAALCDVFVMDAFGAAHRAQASTCGVARHAPVACAGPLLLAELAALAQVLESPRRPLVAIVGGAKVSSKLGAIEALARRVDCLIPGGGIANTFLRAAGYAIGESLFEPSLVAAARDLLRDAAARGCEVALPQDVVVAKDVSADADARVKMIDAVAADDRILDIGPATIAAYAALIETAGTIVWNGPAGLFEIPQFARGTEMIGRAIADADAFSVAGGGDTLAAVERFGLRDGLSCISTGGGAFLEFLQGETLPAVAALKARAGALPLQTP